MVYLLHRYFGRDGRDEAEGLLDRRSGDADNPRILDAFNQACPDWLTFFCFTTFTDRDGKYQLAALAESAFDPLSRTCRFMLTEEAHHLAVGQDGVRRVLLRTAELTKEHPGRDVRELGGIPFDIVQKYVNYWFCYSLDLFGAEVSSNASTFFSTGVKGRYREDAEWTDHVALDASWKLPVLEGGKLIEQDVPMRNAMNEVLRQAYVADTERVLKQWNRALEEAGTDFRVTLPSTRFFRRQGLYAEHAYDPAGNPITREAYAAGVADWLPSDADRAYVASLMHGVYEPGKVANWIAAPTRGIGGQEPAFEYVKRH
jgi:benzoyl-CoA 2,3-dioxygenase component B